MARIDKFRNMTVEQLADFIFENQIDDYIGFCPNTQECQDKLDNLEIDITDEQCKKCLVEWLKSEERVPDQAEAEWKENDSNAENGR